MDKVLITGGTSGIGYELAKIMSKQGHEIVLVSRNLKKLNQVKAELSEMTDKPVTVLAADLSRPESAKEIYEKLKDQGIQILVNNAGVGLKGDFFKDNYQKNQDMAQLNMISLMDLTHYFGRDFVKQKRGRILNIASIVSFFPGPNQPVYYASKAFVRSLTRALAFNLKNTGVTVTALHPGVTRTNFFKSANASFVKSGASPKSVAELGYKAMMNGQIEVTHGIWNKILTNILVRITPYRAQPIILDKYTEV